MQLAIPSLQLSELRRARALLHHRDFRGVEDQRWLFEVIEDEQEHPDRQDQELHGHLEKGVKDQGHAALLQRLGRQVALNLALVGAEVGQRQKQAAE